MKNLNLISNILKILLIGGIGVQTVSAQTSAIWNGTADTTWYTSNKSATTYTITTAEQLAGLARLVNSNYNYSMSSKTIELGANIMLNDTANWQNWGTYVPTRTWTAIGQINSFLGTFDGKGHTISGVYINTTNDYQGLFGTIQSGSTVKNVGILASWIKGGNRVGGVVGFNRRGTVANSYFTGTVSGTSYVGGVVGTNEYSHSWDNISTVANCYATGTVSGINHGGSTTVGGVVGMNGGSAGNCTIANSYFTGTVNGTGYSYVDVGGVTGWNNCTVANSYSTGTVSGTSEYLGGEVGGVVGINHGTVANSYSTGTVSGTSKNGSATVGGVAGWNSNTITNSYWNTSAFAGSGTGGSGSGTATNVTGMTEIQMKNASFASTLNYNRTLLPPISNVAYQSWLIIASVNQGYPTFKIHPKLSHLNYTMPATNLIYNGLPQGINVSSNITGFGAIEVRYNGSNIVPTNVGTYTVTVTIAEGTSNFATMSAFTLGTYTIAKKNISIYEVDPITKTYDGTTTATPGTVAFSGEVLGQELMVGTDYTVTAVFANANVAENKNYTYTVAMQNTTKANNYNLTGGSTRTGTNGVIEKKQITITPMSGQTKVYNAADPETFAFTYSPSLIAGDQLTGKLSRASGDNAGFYAINLGNLSVSDGNNGNNYDLQLSGTVNFEIVKAQIPKPTATNTNLVYNGSEQSAGIAISEFYTITGDKATNAGNYIATVSLKDKANYKWINSEETDDTEDLELPWSIVKKEIVITPTSGQSKVYNTADPEAFAFTNSPSLIAGDQFTGKLSRASGDNAGFYAINLGNLSVSDGNNGNNYDLQLSGTVNFQITKATPPAVTFPTATPIMYNHTYTLVDVALSGGAGDGVFAWENKDIVPTVINDGYKVIFTPSDTENYISLEQIVPLTVNKAPPPPVVSNAPTPALNPISYNPNRPLSEIPLINGEDFGTGTWSWTDGDIIPTVAVSQYYITFTPYDLDNYNWSIFYIWHPASSTLRTPVSLTVQRATHELTPPTASAITYGATLSTSTLTGGSAIGTWAWADGSIIPTVANSGYLATFTPHDLNNYNWNADIGWDAATLTVRRNVSVTVNESTPPYTLPTNLTATYGQTLVGVELPEGWEWKSPTDLVGNVGERLHKAIFTPEDTDNYRTVEIDLAVTVNEDSTPILVSGKWLVVSGQNPQYYNLKGIPMGTTKPIIPGVYIEKTGKQMRKIVVK